MSNTQKLQHSGAAKQRNTNLELFRVITMLFIVAHHYVVNSGLMDVISENPTGIRGLFLMVFGAWGKIGINCFVLITGYFMCRSAMTAKKYGKILLEVLFYRLVINLVFWITGYQPLSLGTLLRLVPISAIDTNFFNTYLVFMLCIPFINILINSLNQKQHIYLMLLMSFMYMFFESLKPVFSVLMNYVSWFFVLYLFASYVRLYPHKVFSSARFWGWAAGITVFLSAASVIVGAWAGTFVGKNTGLYFVTDCNTVLAFCTGFSAFMFFKNVRVPYNRFVNALASTCFGVLLIHANSDTMRQWLWRDVCNNTGVFSKPWMPLHAIGCVLIIFLVCAGIDYLRILFVEKPLFRLWDRHWPKVAAAYQKLENKVFSKLEIPEQKQ